jgi:hypothetical protein
VPSQSTSQIEAERAALFAELDSLEAGPHDGGLGDMLRARLIERIEHRLDVIGRG